MGLGPVLVEPFALWPLGPRFAPWQVVTYGFLHASLTHLGFNMLALYMFGGDLERLWGPKRYLQLYFASLVTAARTLPMMSPRRVVIVLQAQGLLVPKRESEAATRALEELEVVAADPERNLMPTLIDTVNTYATEGEIMAALGDVFGRYVERPVI